jgi:hypothetical protein
VANLAEAVDADIEDIAAGIGMDSRIGPKFLHAGLGYGGSCFPKDVAAFHWVAQQRGVNFQLLQEIRKINETQKDIFFNKVLSALWTLRGKRLAALGLAFKGDTDDIRESPAIDVIKKLLEAGASITAYDPAAMERAKAVLPPSGKLHYAAGIYEAAKDADAVLILTDWKEFANPAQPGGPLPHRDRRAQPLQAAAYARPRIYLRKRWEAGKLPGAAGKAAQRGTVIVGLPLIDRREFASPAPSSRSLGALTFDYARTCNRRGRIPWLPPDRPLIGRGAHCFRRR